MIISTKEFSEVANKILFATGVDKNAANLELETKDNVLYLKVTNRAFYVAVKFPVDSTESLHACVNAPAFLNLISEISTETFELTATESALVIKTGKSKYTLAMIMEGASIMKLPPIYINNKTVEMPISQDILSSIVNVNSKEVQKAKSLDVSELQRLYYINETGCFTFTTGACLNSFTLDKPVSLLLNDQLVKLFKLFKTDVNFSYGIDQVGNQNLQSKIVLQTDSIYLAAIINSDDVLLARVKKPCTATKAYINQTYDHVIVVDVNELNSAVSRLLAFTKNTKVLSTKSMLPLRIILDNANMSLVDSDGNLEAVTIANEHTGSYSMLLNLFDLKAVLDSYKNEQITISCGLGGSNGNTIVLTRGNISNVLPECTDR